MSPDMKEQAYILSKGCPLEDGHTLWWRHNKRDCISNHQPYDCLLNRLFRRRSKKTSKLRVTGLCAGNSPGTGEFPAQTASNAENVSIWWRHHVVLQLGYVFAATGATKMTAIYCRYQTWYTVLVKMVMTFLIFMECLKDNDSGLLCMQHTSKEFRISHPSNLATTSLQISGILIKSSFGCAIMSTQPPWTKNVTLPQVWPIVYISSRHRSRVTVTS